MKQIEHKQITPKVSHFPTTVPPYLETKVCLFVPLFCLSSKTETIKKVLQYVDIVGLVSFFVAVWLCSYVIRLGFSKRSYHADI